MSEPKWVSATAYLKKNAKWAGELYQGQIGRIEGVKWVTSAEWMMAMLKDISAWDLARHWQEINEQYQGQEIEEGRSPDAIVEMK